MSDSAPALMTGLEMAPCDQESWHEALEILYQRTPRDARHRLMADILAQGELGVLDLSGLWIARRRRRVVASLLTQALAGRAAAIWPPEVALERGIDRDATASALVRAALADYRDRGFRLAQALLGPDSPAGAPLDLHRAGLPHVTQLLYLRRLTSQPLEPEPGTPPLLWSGFGPATEREFARVMALTYDGSLDMPELEGLRSLDDVLAGHQAAGRFAPGRWRLGRLPGDPDAAAVVLLSAPEDDLSGDSPWELSYLGLTPRARGRGLGRAALAHALELARPHTGRLELAVDSRNRYAERLYRDAGFLPFDRRDVHVASLAPQADSATLG